MFRPRSFRTLVLPELGFPMKFLWKKSFCVACREGVLATHLGGVSACGASVRRPAGVGAGGSCLWGGLPLTQVLLPQNGDYNKPIPAQYLEHLNHVVSGSAGLRAPAQPPQWVSSQVLLCRRCSHHQTTKIKQLAAFSPRDEVSGGLGVLEAIELLRGALWRGTPPHPEPCAGPRSGCVISSISATRFSYFLSRGHCCGGSRPGSICQSRGICPWARGGRVLGLQLRALLGPSCPCSSESVLPTAW